MGIRFPPAALSAARPRLMGRTGTGTVGMGEAAFPSAAAAARGLCWRSLAGGSRGDGDLGGGVAWHAAPCCFRRPASSAAPVLCCLARRGAGGARRTGADGRVGAGGNVGVDGDMEEEGRTVEQANAKKAGGLKAAVSYLRGVKWMLINGTGVALMTNTLLGLVLYGIYKYGYDKAYGAVKQVLLSYVEDEEMYARVYAYVKKLLLGYLADQDVTHKVYSYSKKLLLDYLADQDIRQKVPAAIQDITYRTLSPINPFPALKKMSVDERAVCVYCAYLFIRWFWLP